MSALILGATGLCGSFFLKCATRSKDISQVSTITRRELTFQSSATQIVEKDSSKWAELIPANTEYLFTALATTRAAAGGLDKQYEIDHDLNIELAKAAKEKGCKVVVLVSSTKASDKSRLPYLKLKGEVERDLIALNFERTIILRPGIILGDRETDHKGFGNGLAVSLGNMVYRSRFQGLFGNPIHAEEIANVGVHLATKESNEKVQIIESSELLDIAASLK